MENYKSLRNSNTDSCKLLNRFPVLNKTQLPAFRITPILFMALMVVTSWITPSLFALNPSNTLKDSGIADLCALLNTNKSIDSRLPTEGLFPADGLTTQAPGKRLVKPEQFPGEKTNFQGFERYSIPVGKNKMTVLCPVSPLPGRQWILAPSDYDLGSAPVANIARTELELLKRGFFVVTLNLGNTYGSPDAIAKWDTLYPILTKKYGMAKRLSLIGLSREGLPITRWAAANRGKVSCLYMDKAVCDIKSWPGGKMGIGLGSQGDWKNLIQLYHFKSEQEAMEYDQNPVNLVRKLVAANVAIIYLAGESDEGVPYAENGAIMEKEYKKRGGIFELILRKGEGHHPHGLQDPTPVVDFIQHHTKY